MNNVLEVTVSAVPTLQEIYDKTALHLLRQDEQSIRGRAFVTECAYRGSKGRSCAVGSWIKDEHYTGAFEGKVADTVAVARALVKSGALPDYPELWDPSLGDDMDVRLVHENVAGKAFLDRLKTLMRLQGVHDNSHPSDWPRRLIETADKCELSYDVVLKFQDGKA